MRHDTARNSKRHQERASERQEQEPHDLEEYALRGSR
jgi:hypothetical protein